MIFAEAVEMPFRKLFDIFADLFSAQTQYVVDKFEPVFDTVTKVVGVMYGVSDAYKIMSEKITRSTYGVPQVKKHEQIFGKPRTVTGVTQGPGIWDDPVNFQLHEAMGQHGVETEIEAAAYARDARQAMAAQGNRFKAGAMSAMEMLMAASTDDDNSLKMKKAYDGICPPKRLDAVKEEERRIRLVTERDDRNKNTMRAYAEKEARKVRRINALAGLLQVSKREEDDRDERMLEKFEYATYYSKEGTQLLWDESQAVDEDGDVPLRKPKAAGPRIPGVGGRAPASAPPAAKKKR